MSHLEERSETVFNDAKITQLSLTKKPTFEARAHPPADPAFMRYLEVLDPSARREFKTESPN
jgi:hypothetical protein